MCLAYGAGVRLKIFVTVNVANEWRCHIVLWQKCGYATVSCESQVLSWDALGPRDIQGWAKPDHVDSCHVGDSDSSDGA